MVQVEGGRAYLVRVPGAAQSPISDKELQLIIKGLFKRFARFGKTSNHAVKSSRKSMITCQQDVVCIVYEAIDAHDDGGGQPWIGGEVAVWAFFGPFI